jgi:hypothetical protein
MEVSPLPAEILRKHFISVRELDGLTNPTRWLDCCLEVAARISSQVPPPTFEAKLPMTFLESPEKPARKF